MSSGIQFTDILIVLEPTGFSSQDASLYAGRNGIHRYDGEFVCICLQRPRVEFQTS